MSDYSVAKRLSAEFFGTAFLLATVVGSGIMGEALAGGNTAIALLGNTIPTGAILVVLITLFGPISGAHFNPAVTVVFAIRKEITFPDGLAYVVVQVLGGIAGVWAAHLMFDIDVWQLSQKARTGHAQWFAEVVATFGLIITILGTLKARATAATASRCSRSSASQNMMCSPSTSASALWVDLQIPRFES